MNEDSFLDPYWKHAIILGRFMDPKCFFNSVALLLTDSFSEADLCGDTR